MGIGGNGIKKFIPAYLCLCINKLCVYVCVCVCMCVCVCVCVCRPITFNLCTVNVKCIAQYYGIYFHCYADDIQLYINCRANESAVAKARLLDCIKAIDNWLLFNRIKMNPDKTQVI